MHEPTQGHLRTPSEGDGVNTFRVDFIVKKTKNYDSILGLVETMICSIPRTFVEVLEMTRKTTFAGT